jgi:predicted phosphodiesterase
MKVALHSDLHLEGNSLPANFLEDKDFDVLVLAGDIVTHKHFMALADIRNACPADKIIIYVSGNHEYYRGSLDITDAMLREFCDHIGIIYANNSVVRLDGKYSFVCSTAWSSLESFHEYSYDDKKEASEFCIADFRLIADHSVEKMVERGKRDAKFIETSLKVIKEEHPDDVVVVVTHFSPTENHGNDKFAPSPISAYFSNKLEGIMYEYEPDYWFYGHTHYKKNIPVYHTKVFSNQRGYGSECAGDYDPNFIVDVS